MINRPEISGFIGDSVINLDMQNDITIKPSMKVGVSWQLSSTLKP